MVSGKIISIGNDGKIIETTYEELITEWLKANTPPAVETSVIGNALGIPYATLQPKLRQIAEKKSNKRKGIVFRKMERIPGTRGRRKYIWSYEK